MDQSFDAGANASLLGEAYVRPDESCGLLKSNSLEASLNLLNEEDAYAVTRLNETFMIPESQVGLQGLLAELRVDLAELTKIFDIPNWCFTPECIRSKLIEAWKDDHVRDLGALRSQRKNPLKDFLSPVHRSLTVERHRGVRAARGLIAISLLAAGEQIRADLTTELKKWFEGKGPELLVPGLIQAHQLRELRQGYATDSPTAKLITHLIRALEAKLKDPFAPHKVKTNFVTPPKHDVADENEPEEKTSAANKSFADPLRGFLAEPGNSGVRVFSGVILYGGMQTFELKLIIPRVIEWWQTTFPDEGLAALMTLFTRVLPTRFSRIPLSVVGDAGIWIDVDAGCICVNLDEIISSHQKENPFERSPKDRFISIPLPIEIGNDLKFRAQQTNAQSLDQLFHRDMADLAVSTKSMLRKLALTSHRPTLKHLSDSWARYVLSSCNDEAYASGIGIDFTVGTAVNFNYFTMRKTRVAEILGEAYSSIGFSGELSLESIQDVGSLRIPDTKQAGAFLKSALTEVSVEIRQLPKRVSKKKLQEAHNHIATLIYAVLKFLLGGRALEEESISRLRLDPVSGLVIQTDKRTSPYHERRLGLMCPTLCSWLNTYLSWIRLLAYRFYSIDRSVASKLATIIDVSPDNDVHPLFFGFNKDDDAVPLGNDDLSLIFRKYDIVENGGRHFLDSLFREGGLGSADVMGWMGRGYPGQETYGSWSAAIPLETLQKGANVIERWLTTLSLPVALNLSSRPLPFVATRSKLSHFVPKLFESQPDWSKNHSRPAEPCPFTNGAVALAGLYKKMFDHWRHKGPPTGWLGVALSLVIEDGVIHRDELEGILRELQQGTLYQHERIHFADCISAALGVRRTRLSETTIRLVFNIIETNQNHVSLSDLENLLDDFMDTGFPEAKGRGFDFLLKCAASCYSVRMPGVMYGWVRGFRFARTSRPETVARHLMGIIEQPMFDVSRRKRQRYLRTHENIRQALAEAAREADGKKLHNSQIESLMEDLLAILPDFDESSYEYVLISYLLYLCKTQKNIFTIIRYETGARSFLVVATTALAELGASNVEWKALVDSCLKNDDDSTNKSPDRTAINHALEWLGIDLRTYRRSGPPVAAFQYAEIPSSRELKLAIDFFLARKSYVGDDWHLAAVALQLLAQHPHRWDEVANLRLCDLKLDSKNPHLVISYEANANLKTRNAPRVLEIEDKELVANLKEIYAQRVARFSGDLLVPIFGDNDNPRTTGAADRIHQLIDQALTDATGSAVIRPHDIRHFPISRSVAALLDSNEAKRLKSTLAARQGMFQITVDAGQSAPDVTMENYAHDFDVHRRKWVDKINRDLGCQPSTEFISKVTGVPTATYRKRTSRIGASAFDMFEGFDPGSLLTTEVKQVQLSSFVVNGQDHLPWNFDVVSDDALTGAAIYVGLRILGESAESARLAAKLTVNVAENLERGIVGVNRRRASPLKARADINRNAFIDSVIEGGLAIAMQAVSPSHEAINHLVTAMSELGGPLSFANPEDILDLKPWVTVWQANGIEPAATLKPSHHSTLDDFILDQWSDIGIRQKKGIPARHFSRGVRALLKFMPEGISGNASHSRASPQLSFLVSVCALSILLLTRGI